MNLEMIRTTGRKGPSEGCTERRNGYCRCIGALIPGLAGKVDAAIADSVAEIEGKS